MIMQAVVRPSIKLIKAGYTATILVLIAAIIVHVNYLPEGQFPWLPGLAALLILWPATRHVRRQAKKMTITGDKLRYESGFLSKTIRTIQLSKVQDVRVEQSLAQRMLAIGDISIETSGETSRLTIENIDSPQAIADDITEASREHGKTQSGGKRS